MKKIKHNNILIRGVGLIQVLALLIGLVPGALAMETIPAETEKIIPVTEPVTEPTVGAALPTVSLPEETAPAMNSDSSTAVQQLQDAAAAYVEKWHLNDGMTDENMANLYFTFDSEESWDAWSTLDELKEQVLLLSADEQNMLFQDTNAQLCWRFYNVMAQINTPAILADITGLPVIDNIQITTTGATNVTETSGTVTITATGTTTGSGCSTSNSSTTVTITIKNASTKPAILSFTHRLENGGSIVFSDPEGDSNNIYTKQLPGNGTFTITLTSAAGANNTTTLTLSGFKWNEATTKYNVTFLYDESLGSLKVNNTSVKSGESLSLSAADMVMTTDADLVGWINESTHQIIPDTINSYSPTADITMRAVLAGENSPAWFLVDGNKWYDDLNAASDEALKISNKTIVLAHDGTLPAGNYTIDSGVTLLIPFDENNTLYTTEPEAIYRENAALNVTAFRTLTMAKGANISVDGALSLSAQVNAASGGRKSAGSPFGPVSFIDMQEGSSITVNGGANLYAWGYITGDGLVTAESNATVYECFQFMDFRGGSVLQNMATGKSANGVFPISQYYFQNIEAPLIIESGAKEITFTAIYARLFFNSEVCTGSVTIFGPSDAMFNVIDGSVTKRYDGTTDRLILEVDGEMSVAPLALDVMSISLNSAEYELAINSNISLTVKKDSKLNITQDIALLPGVSVTIDEGGTVALGSGTNAYVYDADQWGNYSFPLATKFNAIVYAPGKSYTRTAADLKDAEILVNGTLDTSAGYLYTTCGIPVAKGSDITDTTGGGANIHSTGKGIVKVNPGTEANTYQFQQVASGDIAAQTYFQIPITPAKLLNGDGTTYVDTSAKADTYTYELASGLWHKKNCDHKYTAVTETLPTYLKEGSEKYTCTCGTRNYSSPVPKVVQLAAFAASAAEEIILDLKVRLPDTVATVTVTQTVKGSENGTTATEEKTYNISDITTDSANTGAYRDASGRYVFTRGVASGEMTLPVTLTFKDSSGKEVLFRPSGITEVSELTDNLSRTVVDYAELVLKQAGTSDAITKQKDIITYLLTYGGYAQLNFNVETNKPAYNLLGTYGISIPAIPDSLGTIEAASATGIISGITGFTEQTFLDSAIYHRVYFTLDTSSNTDIQQYTYLLTYPIGGVTQSTPKTLTLEHDEETGKYWVDIENIPAAYLDYMYTITVTDGSETYTIQTSVLSYLANKLIPNSSGNTNLINLAKAMYLYNQAADRFFFPDVQ